MSPGERLHFEAVLLPHRSLSRRGLTLVIGFVLTASAGITAFFWSLGAWPVAGFNGAEALAALLILRTHARASRHSETIRLTDRALHILRTGPPAPAELTLDPAWLRIQLEERPGRLPAVIVRSRQRQTELASALSEPERRAFADALEDALQRWRAIQP